MYYFSDQQDYSKVTMNLNCEVFRYDGSCAPSTGPKLAFHHHFHESIEILAVKKGTVQITVDDRRYSLGEGEVILINPFRLHSGIWSATGEETEYICITFLLKKWLDFHDSVLLHEKNSLNEGKKCFDEFYDKERQPGIWSIIETISDVFSKKDEASECYLASAVYRLLAELFFEHYHPTEAEKANHGNVSFMTEVSRYLSAHYTESISTADIASTLYMSVPSFCYQFKKHFATTFLHYLAQYRITRATELYQEKPRPLQELSAIVGFYDYCYFSRLFRRYMGTSPSEYFKK